MSSLPPLVRALSHARAYPHAPARVEVLETHISWVLLTGGLAYKVKKPVSLGFADFSTLERRRWFCEEELRLNRRLATDLYLAVVPISGTEASPEVEGRGEPIEWAVKMREFPQEARGDRAIARGALSKEAIDRIALDVARFHAAAAVAPPDSPHGTPERVMSQVDDVCARLLPRVAGSPLAGEISPLRSRAREEGERLRGVFAARKRSGFVRECHGDLHLGNVALLPSGPVVFDALEFDESLRFTDVMSDAAFLAMDLSGHGRADLSRRFLDRYLSAGGDYAGLAVHRYHAAYRALVRALVASIRSEQEGELAGAFVARYAAVARRALESAPIELAIMHGLSGSGKSTLSEEIVEKEGAIRIRSDVERKRLFGLGPTARTDDGLDRGIYSREATAKTFDRLALLAETILGAGFTAVVDAAFLRRAERDRFRALAERTGARFSIVHAEAPIDVLRERIRARAAAARDASDASLAVLERQRETAEPLAEDEKRYQVPFPPDDPAEA